ncbi:DUF805 family (yhaH) [Commensalibacter communis]|uniref:DUF805 domain-containing protein n=1 Tax=Commensalibacter communis TaxID=2972786 RepID=UPI0022FFA782|nr:DUF805 domain-containing protein [Commensalibacter communis]CAI3926054.1 DUF805 family (yhaH) [Commensalibacter communis]CAI3928870.1 DUF805 family (yhaH) [Commensalibacter communis]
MQKLIRNILLFIKNIPRGWIDAWRHYFYFKGRTNRSGFWSFAIMNSLVAYVLFLLSAQLGLVYGINLYTKYVESYLLFTIYIIASMAPSFCLCIRRLHDLNLRGFWFWIWLLVLFVSIPYMYVNFVCQWFILLVACYPSSENERFGSPPQSSFTV